MSSNPHSSQRHHAHSMRGPCCYHHELHRVDQRPWNSFPREAGCGEEASGGPPTGHRGSPAGARRVEGGWGRLLSSVGVRERPGLGAVWTRSRLSQNRDLAMWNAPPVTATCSRNDRVWEPGTPERALRPAHQGGKDGATRGEPGLDGSDHHTPACDTSSLKAARHGLRWPMLTMQWPWSMVTSGPCPKSPVNRCSLNVEQRPWHSQLLRPAAAPDARAV